MLRSEPLARPTAMLIGRRPQPAERPRQETADRDLQRHVAYPQASSLRRFDQAILSYDIRHTEPTIVLTTEFLTGFVRFRSRPSAKGGRCRTKQPLETAHRHGDRRGGGGPAERSKSGGRSAPMSMPFTIRRVGRPSVSGSRSKGPSTSAPSPWTTPKNSRGGFWRRLPRESTTQNASRKPSARSGACSRSNRPRREGSSGWRRIRRAHESGYEPVGHMGDKKHLAGGEVEMGPPSGYGWCVTGIIAFSFRLRQRYYVKFR